MLDYFSNLPDEKKTELFHEVVSTICEFFYTERYSFLHGLGMPDDEILARRYLTEAGMLAGGAEIQQPRNDDLRLQDVLQYDLTDDLFLIHAQGGDPVPLDLLHRLTRGEQSSFSDLMDAHIRGSRAGAHGTELIVDGIEPERVEKLGAALVAHEKEYEMTM